ncbi:hypothetical protein [Aquimarina rubra]|uniref:Uncharacterized protein n=1 Tax=Aquimarina rubra TaxID=1920033 RepID=A0ABW5LDG5_9FLAO
MNLHQDIKYSILKHFDFLKDVGFSEFEEKQLAYEIHFFCHREEVKLDICYELIYSTPIWITINGIDIMTIQKNNLLIKNIYEEKKSLYDSNFKEYLKSNKTEYLKINEKKYEAVGKKLNDNLLQEVSRVLKDKGNLLLSDFSEIEKAEKQRLTEIENQKKEYLKENGIYTCEYNWNGLICEHEGTLREIEEHLMERKDMDLTEIVILDRNGNNIKK